MITRSAEYLFFIRTSSLFGVGYNYLQCYLLSQSFIKMHSPLSLYLRDIHIRTFVLSCHLPLCPFRIHLWMEKRCKEILGISSPKKAKLNVSFCENILGQCDRALLWLALGQYYNISFVSPELCTFFLPCIFMTI